MRAIVMVEGHSDEVFFERLLELKALRQAVEIYQYAEVGYIKVVRAQLNLSGAQLILLRDLGSATEEGLRTDIDKNLQTIGEVEQVEVSR